MISLELETEDEARFLLDLLLDPFSYAEQLDDASEEMREELTNRLDNTIKGDS